MDKLDNDIISIIKKYLKCHTHLCKNYGIYQQYRAKFYCSNCYKKKMLVYYNNGFDSAAVGHYKIWNLA